MFVHSAQFYDAIYAWKDYAAEARRLKALLAERLRIAGRRTLPAESVRWMLRSAPASVSKASRA